MCIYIYIYMKSIRDCLLWGHKLGLSCYLSGVLSRPCCRAWETHGFPFLALVGLGSQDAGQEAL